MYSLSAWSLKNISPKVPLYCHCVSVWLHKMLILQVTHHREREREREGIGFSELSYELPYGWSKSPPQTHWTLFTVWGNIFSLLLLLVSVPQSLLWLSSNIEYTHSNQHLKNHTEAHSATPCLKKDTRKSVFGSTFICKGSLFGPKPWYWWIESLKNVFQERHETFAMTGCWKYFLLNTTDRGCPSKEKMNSAITSEHSVPDSNVHKWEAGWQNQDEMKPKP